MKIDTKQIIKKLKTSLQNGIAGRQFLLENKQIADALGGINGKGEGDGFNELCKLYYENEQELLEVAKISFFSSTMKSKITNQDVLDGVNSVNLANNLLGLADDEEADIIDAGMERALKYKLYNATINILDAKISDKDILRAKTQIICAFAKKPSTRETG